MFTFPPFPELCVFVLFKLLIINSVTVNMWEIMCVCVDK